MSQQINLFNPIFLKQKKYFSAVTMVQALGLILLGLAALVIYAGLQAAGLNRDLAATAGQLAATQAQLTKVTVDFEPRQKSKTLDDDIQKAAAELKSVQVVFDILKKGEFGNTAGYSEYLRAFSRQSFEGMWLTGLSIVGAGNEIDIQGRALQSESVPLYLSRLKREPVMQGKSFASLEMQVQMPPNQDLSKKEAASGSQKTGMTERTQGYIAFNLRSSAGTGEVAGTLKAVNQ